MTAAHLDDLSVQSLLLEEAPVFGDKDEAAPLVETGKDEDDFLQRRGGLRRWSMKHGKEEKTRTERQAKTSGGAHKGNPAKQSWLERILGLASLSCQVDSQQKS